jgi:hypothetical protein
MHTFEVRVRNSVRIQPVVSEGIVLESDATSWKANASLAQVILGAFRFNSTGQRTYLTTPVNSF